MGSPKNSQNTEIPVTQSRGLSELLGQAEGPSLDWKRDFPNGIAGGSGHLQREEHRGKLLKSLVSIANSVVDERGYLVYGVEDKNAHRTIVGVRGSFDDATFQDWNVRAFSPPLQFRYREEAQGAKTVGVFEVTPSSDYPHVCATDVGDELRAGQVWFRRGSRNTLGTYADLKRMFASPEPMRTTEGDGALVRQIKAFWEPLGWEVFWPTVNDRDEKLAQGYRLAYAPESRREIRLSSSNVDAHVLMLRRK